MKNGFMSILILLSALSCRAEARILSVPQKFLDRDLRKAEKPHSPFTNEEIETGDFIRFKRSEWEACHQKKSVMRMAFSPLRDRLPPFVESNEILRDLQEMENHSLKTGRADRQPWSGDYWPYSSGLIASRFFDPGFQEFVDWKDRYDYVNSHPLIQFLSPEKLSQLSPAEKYDLLTGSQQGTLTKSMWAQGKIYFDEKGDVEGWMGLCHGWAPAAIVEPRPEKAIQVTSADGQQQLDLVPAELKGLLTYSWATNSYDSAMLGERCNEENPAEDENGRLQNPDCFDLNPGTWHLAIVNRLGLRKKSFVMDATYDYQVWNQPVLEYSYQYFHPQTGQAVSSWKNAQISLSDWNEDPYRKYRSPEARSIVGVQMKVAYMIESRVGDAREDSASHDLIRWVVYTYDLELDEKDQIIGGEWHQVAHPDFIWTPLENARPNSTLDSALKGPWDPEMRLPAQWIKTATKASSHGVILNQVVQGLLRKSRVNPE
jgi:hypothetical protein